MPCTSLPRAPFTSSPLVVTLALVSCTSIGDRNQAISSTLAITVAVSTVTAIRNGLGAATASAASAKPAAK
jgi:hypothetical protein